MHSKGSGNVLQMESDGTLERLLWFPESAQRLLGHSLDLCFAKLLIQRPFVRSGWDSPQTSNVLCVLLLFCKQLFDPDELMFFKTDLMR